MFLNLDSVYAALVRFVSHSCRKVERFLSKKWADYQAQRHNNKNPMSMDAQTELLGNSTDNTEMIVRNPQENESPNETRRRPSMGLKSNGSTKRELLLYIYCLTVGLTLQKL